MTIILIIFILLTIITFRPTKFNEEYLSKRYTNIIKGIFLILVFFSHFIGYSSTFQNNWIDAIGIKSIKMIGQLIVTLFLFYSGYGIMESAKKKGSEYVSNMPKKRLLPTLIHFDIAVLIFMVASKYFVTHSFSIKKVGLSLIGWDTFGNSNWYIFCILILYGIAFLSLKSFKTKRSVLISMFIGTLLYTIIMSFYKESYWYNTAFCFVLGSAYSAYKEKIETWINGKEMISFIYLLIIFIIAYKLRKNIIWYDVYTLVFTLIIVIITRKFIIKNIILEWMGKNLFPMYIFQRLPMMFLNKYELMRNNPYIFFIVCIILTVIITLIYNFIMFIYTKIKEKVIKNISTKKESLENL